MELIPIGRVVADLQGSYPDVTHSSLRFLEREGLVIPTRTPGGHRLYRPQDIERIRQIKAWQNGRNSPQPGPLPTSSSRRLWRAI
jgi:DNA-binding transcriptional MerR regulator